MKAVKFDYYITISLWKNKRIFIKASLILYEIVIMISQEIHKEILN